MELTNGFFSVGKHMSFQHLLPLERLATKVADEGQRISMQMEMPFQMAFEREA